MRACVHVLRTCVRALHVCAGMWVGVHLYMCEHVCKCTVCVHVCCVSMCASCVCAHVQVYCVCTLCMCPLVCSCVGVCSSAHVHVLVCACVQVCTCVPVYVRVPCVCTHGVSPPPHSQAANASGAGSQSYQGTQARNTEQMLVDQMLTPGDATRPR